MKLVLATKNKHKVEEIKQILKIYLDDELYSRIEILSAGDFIGVPEIEEDGKTYIENALKKAKEIHKFTGLPSIADDSGIEVDFLNGEPGVYSARYAGLRATDEENNRKLLKKLEDVPLEKRTATFKCVIAYVNKNEEKIFEGETKGKVIFEPRGMGGFGYDPLFVPDGYELTYAEMPEDLKNKISHRSKAIQKFAEFLTLILKTKAGLE
ncbi:RdgB/HAM1 family non-canonical purine NTP pyrophosphatase [Candidatus Kryptobacter tengchongensis]|uniref:RdgB/HAM1 family non-canonical purine NTP pyrophosphatase n=1 Tax=Kryptobacter tengchongensis TaxID=1643429 RepID=UPI00070809E1|nr:RdgB/HAM1 family non-canonical purine NTP pyrophosphatase [Candidatus Kryptobacter tengchongensis]CUS77139.1 XTP/dITP diphosphohydrolase [Candidatus Kryptobacter tengchongensis]